MPKTEETWMDGITTEMMEHRHCLNCGQRLKWEV